MDGKPMSYSENLRKKCCGHVQLDQNMDEKVQCGTCSLDNKEVPNEEPSLWERPLYSQLRS